MTGMIDASRGSRRAFLRLGGGAAVAAFIASACSGDGSDETASTLAPPESRPISDWPLDVAYAQTAVSLELAAARINERIVASGFLGDGSIALLGRINANHAAHRAVMEPIVTDAAVEVVDAPNAVVLAVTEPALSLIAAEGDALGVAHRLETMLSQAYVFFTSEFSTAELRSRSASIAAADNRHQAVLATRLAIDQFAVGDAYVPVENPAPSAVIYG